jgi:hypothetical protein
MRIRGKYCARIKIDKGRADLLVSDPVKTK